MEDTKVTDIIQNTNMEEGDTSALITHMHETDLRFAQCVKYGAIAAVAIGLGAVAYKKVLKPFMQKIKDKRAGNVVDANAEEHIQ